ncbi:MAG: HD domain-containing protein [Acidobacteria bacterium]|nr:HD domain-containing protein [Acidobacteriota bacterium]
MGKSSHVVGFGEDPDWDTGRAAGAAFGRLRGVVAAGHGLLEQGTEGYQKALESSCAQIGVPVGLLFILRPEGDTLELMASQGIPCCQGDVPTIGVQEGLSGWVAAARTMVVVNDVEDDGRFGPVSALGYRRLSAISVPLEHDGDLLGVLTLASPQPNAFATEDLLVVEALATNLSLGLRCREYREAEARNYLGIIRGLATALEAKDAVTRGHSARVAHMCHHIGLALGVEQPALERLEVAASLHDLGKIGVPEAVLNKPGPLDSHELELIRRHPAVGAEMLEEIPLLSDLAPVVRGHHERFGGGGYPDGLEGHGIPLHSRIIAVADALDAMLMPRPYRRDRTVDEALAELRECSGTHFDPRVVEALTRVVTAEGCGHFFSPLPPACCTVT